MDEGERSGGSVVVVSEGADPAEFSVQVHFENGKGGAPDEDDEATENTPLNPTTGEKEEEEEEEGSGGEGEEWRASDLFPPADEADSTTDDESDTTALVKLQGEGVTRETGEEVGDVEERRREGKKSSILGASFNFTNSIIGAGIIGIPAAIQLAGFVPGVMLLLLVAVITNYTVLLLIKNGIICGKFSYQEMITVAFGRPGFWLLTVLQLLFPFFATAGYVVIVGDTFSRIIEQFFLLADAEPMSWAINTSFIKVVTILVVMLPLSLLRNIAMLEKFSALAVLFVIIVVLFTMVKAVTYYCAVRCLQPSCCDSPVTIWAINTDFVESVGIMAFAFVCHHNTFLIYGSLKRRSLTRFSHVSHLSVSASTVFCAALGMAGFLTFMSETRGDLLNNYCVHDWAATVARFLYACVIMLTFPIEIFVCREVLEIMLSRLPYRLISWISNLAIRRALDRFLFSPRRSSIPRHVTLTLGLVAASLLVGISTDDLGVVLGFNGCLMATPIAFILPTASYLRLSHRSASRWFAWDRMAAWIVMVIGFIVMVIGTALAIVQAVHSFSHSDSTHPAYCPDTSSAHQSLDMCCSLLNSTHNFSLSVPLCDCSSLCGNGSVLLSPDLYCQ